MKPFFGARWLVGLFAVLGFAGVLPADAAPSASPTLHFSPLSQSVLLGQQAQVWVGINGTGAGAAPSIGTYDVDIAFDETIVAVAGVSFGGFLGYPDDSIALEDISVAGHLYLVENSLLSSTDLHALQPDAFTLAVVTFDTLSVGTTALQWHSALVGDTEGGDLSALLSAGSITVTAVPEPATLPALGLGLFVIIGWVRCARRPSPFDG